MSINGNSSKALTKRSDHNYNRFNSITENPDVSIIKTSRERVWWYETIGSNRLTVGSISKTTATFELPNSASLRDTASLIRRNSINTQMNYGVDQSDPDDHFTSARFNNYIQSSSICDDVLRQR